MKFGLTAYGTVFYMGLHPQAENPRITALEQMKMAEEYGLEGVELPYDILVDADLGEVREYARDHRLFINIAAGGFDPEHLKSVLELGGKINARTVRTVVGGADFGGDRRKMNGRWQSFLDEILVSFREAVKTAEKVGVNLTVENHQDLASEELLWLCETIDSSYFGITLDAGNPLATAEVPMDFFVKMAPHIKNVHLKDYKIFWSDEGYRLARCPVGQGVIDFPALFSLMENVNPNITLSIEHGALEARHVRVLQEDYWTEYPDRTAQQLTRLLRFVEDHAFTKGDWRTPYEKGESAEAIATYEMEEMAVGMAYLSYLMKNRGKVCI
ncbi:sugar phosphate isomerase/epimerase family protein [Lederbergia panacisoli]|uniref:sugar phosphate isomerase/epimerase family protein n=1 Tax=Lederbergia panacisoli TaxID=1255251 RepID=UPI00214C53FF|nr:sugar phosphate isomerase/epimerase [Lederbergia panacisoli]MCR2822960.1 sugar phosphate isomerase/epimerase [Lederbergia panacisoli]